MVHLPLTTSSFDVCTMGAPSTAFGLAFSSPCPVLPSHRRSCSTQKRLRHRNHGYNDAHIHSPSTPFRLLSLGSELISQMDDAQPERAANHSTSTIQQSSSSASGSVSSGSDPTATSSQNPGQIGGALTGPNCRRSKLVLTRRVFSWTLRRRLARNARNERTKPSISGTLSPDMESSPPPPPPIQTLLGQRFPADVIPIDSMLQSNEPVATFVFHRGYTPIIKRRRSGDPPNRYLRLSYGLVEPFSSSAYHCSNPRATGSLKGWYQAAARWNVLEADFRPSLVLKPSQRVYNDGSKICPVDYSSTSPASPDPFVQKRTPHDVNSANKENKTVSPSSNGSVSPTETSSPSTTNSSVLDSNLLWDEDAGVPISPLLTSGRWERSLGRSPRIIAVGDVHGCIDELQQLLRLADYQPGDQVVLLGDLVAKGPDSAGVVQLAREIGARSVRGNHDFEVVRWFEACRTGNADSIVSAEHARIARMLSEADHAWLVDCPWFIECSEMDHLFVHAGFIPGVKLTQQNPRLMMNMRSVLQDGTVTAKSVEDCEWAKLWQGPQTVVFGHDAVRGLQEHQYARGIDTGCVYGGRLTALLLPENRLISVAAKRAYIRPKRYRLVS